MKPTRHSSLPALRHRFERRRGFTTPAVAIAMLVTMAGLALILDRLWLDAADLELTTAAEAAALAAAGELATDDLMKPNSDISNQLELGRTSAAWIASQNQVAGVPVVLDPNPEGDVRYGRLVVDEQEGKVRFEETATTPTTAVVTAQRTRRSSNPVSLFVTGVTGQPFGDVVTRVEASIDNRVCGVRPEEGTPVPAVPLAIWWRDPAGVRLDTWENQIEARKGPDQLGYDTFNHVVTSGADGIPEITLRSGPGRGQPSVSSNMLVVDLGTGLNDKELGRQFITGWTAADLETFGGELRLGPGASLSVKASTELRHADREGLETLIGEPRICLLYSSVASSGNGQVQQAICMRLIAIRILAVRDQGDGSCELIAQPSVVKTKTAILDVPSPYSTENVVPVSPYAGSAGSTAAVATGNASAATTSGNPYIYKLQLTH